MSETKADVEVSAVQLLSEIRSWVSCSQSCQFREKCICGAQATLADIEAVLERNRLAARPSTEENK